MQCLWLPFKMLCYNNTRTVIYIVECLVKAILTSFFVCVFLFLFLFPFSGLINVITNAPVHEEQLVTLLTIGMSEVHFSPADALEYMDQVVMRSAAAHTSG